MALHMSTRVYIQKISSLFELEVLQLINGIGNQTVWEKSTVPELMDLEVGESKRHFIHV